MAELEHVEGDAANAAGPSLADLHAQSDGGWLGTGDDQTSELTMELGEQSLSQAMASRGALGIAKLVTADVKRHDSKAASSGSATSHLRPPNMGSTR